MAVVKKVTLVMTLLQLIICSLFVTHCLGQQAAPPEAERVQTAGPAAPTLEALAELETVWLQTSDGQRSYGFDPQALAVLLPAATTLVEGERVVDYRSLLGALSSAMGELYGGQLNLSEQVHHLVLEKAALERRLHATEAQLASIQEALLDLQSQLDARSATASGRQ